MNNGGSISTRAVVRRLGMQVAVGSILGFAFSGMVGCASMAPPYERPPLPVSETYPAAAETPPTAILAPAPGWRDYFADPRLQSLIDLALVNNRELRGAILRVEEARAAWRIQRAESLPIVAAGAVSLRGRLPTASVTGQALEPDVVALGVGLSSWELDFWGRVRSLKTAALESYLATDAARRAATLAIITQVANGYLSLREIDERLALARRALANREESLRIFRRRVDVGATSKLDLTQVELLSLQASALLAQLELTRAAQAHAMELLLGAPADLSPGSERFDELAVLPQLPPGLPSDLLTRRPDIVAAEHALIAANANIGAARAAFFPRISLTSFLGLASDALSSLFEGDNHAWAFAPSLALPLFDGGRRGAARDVAEVRRDEAIARYEQAIQAAFRDVSDALAARQWLGEQVRILQATLAVQNERARLAKLRYDHGATPYLQVLDAEREQLAVEQQLVQTRRALLSSQVALYGALGGGELEKGSAP